MRILFLSPAYAPFPGGGERYAGALGEKLAERGHEVTAVTSLAQREHDLWQGTAQREIVTEEREGVNIIRCPIRPFPGGRRGLFAWRKVMVLLSMLPGDQTAVLRHMAHRIPPLHGLEQTLAQLPHSFDLVQGFNISWEYSLVAGWQYARRRQIPFVVIPFAHLGTPDDRIALNSTMDHQMRLMREADRVLTLTSIESEELAARGIASERLAVIGGGLDALPPLPDQDVLLAQYGLQRPYVTFVGRASYDKGAIHAAEAILALRQQGVDIRLVSIGQTAPEFDRFVAGLDETDRDGIRPLGLLSDSDKHGLLAASTALLLPSRTDSFGIVFLESWAHGRPVIGARAGGIPGLVADGEDGLLVPFGDVPALAQAINRLLTDTDLAAKMGQRGQKKVSKRYTWDRVSDYVLTIYEQILAAAP